MNRWRAVWVPMQAMLIGLSTWLQACQIVADFDHISEAEWVSDAGVGSGGRPAEVDAGVGGDGGPSRACTPGERRCNRRHVETCGDAGTWQLGALCTGPCAGGECVDVAVAAGHHHTCAMLRDGRVACWGQNDRCQAGGLTSDICPDGPCVRTPTLLPLNGVSTISALGHHTCALVANEIQCWGSGEFGQLGPDLPSYSCTPVGLRVPTMIDDVVVDVKVGGGEQGGIAAAHTCALTAGGRMYCWGSNCAWQLGIKTGGPNQQQECPGLPYCSQPDAGYTLTTPMPLVGLPFRPIQIALGPAHTCALDDTGHVHCWGLNMFGQLGQVVQRDGIVTPSFDCSLLPQRVPNLDDVVQIAAGGLYTCALKGDGTVACWGGNFKGVVGSAQLIAPPTIVEQLFGVAEVGGGHGSTACARTNTGKAVCWGDNENAEAGKIDGTTPYGKIDPPRVGPTEVGGPDGVVSIGVGGNHACAFGHDDRLWCWGQTSFGAVDSELLGPPTKAVEVDLSKSLSQ